MNFEEKVNEYLQSDEFLSFRNQLKKYENDYRIIELFDFLDDTDFWFAPASSKHHLREIGGLAKHCWHVFEFLQKQRPDNTEQNLLLAFTHDLCKLGLYIGQVSKTFEHYTDEEMRMRELIEQCMLEEAFDSSAFIENCEYFEIDPKDHFQLKKFLYGRGKKLRTTYDVEKITFSYEDNFPVGHGEKSVIIALQCGFPLTREEIVAIRWHMEFDDKAWPFYRNNVHKQFYEITKALQRADQDATQKELQEDV